MNEEVKKCVSVLRKGGIILYPTDTIWGIGCDAANETAVSRIYELKRRHSSKTMLVLVSEPNQLSFYAQIPPVAIDLVEYTNIPLTIIYPGAKAIAKNLIAPDGTIAIRVVKDEFCKKLIYALHKPLVSTSANISNEPAPLMFDDISDSIKCSVDYVVNMRQHETKKNTPSRIIKISMDGTIEIIRK